MKAKVAKYGGRLDQITDVLRGSLVFKTAEQLSAAMAFLFREFREAIVWVSNRLGVGSGGGGGGGGGRGSMSRTSRTSRASCVGHAGGDQEGSSTTVITTTVKGLWGYRDVLLLLRLGGHVCELQLHLKAMIKARPNDNGHELFAADAWKGGQFRRVRTLNTLRYRSSARAAAEAQRRRRTRV